MNKVFNINLGSYPFTIDKDAYNHLRTYLETIHNHFRHTEGYEEITHDIEARLAELFLEQLGNRPIVNFQDVEDAIAIMGRPEEFGADPMSEGATAQGTGTTAGKEGFKIKTGKRLYRDPEEGMIGGVAAGLTAYFGIPDHIWVRFFFVIIVISGGIGIPLYFILWALMPAAKTAGDRLAMRGEPINISNISKIITEEFEHLSEKMTELGEELSGKKKSPRKNGDEDQGNAQRFTAVNDTLSQTWEAAREQLPKVGKVLRTILIIAAIFFILIFSLVWLGIIAGVTFAMPFLNNFFPGQEFMSVVGMVNVLFVIGIPLLSVILLIVRLVFRRRMGRGWTIGLGIFWFINVFSLISTGGNLSQEFIAEESITQSLDAAALNTDTVTLSYYRLQDHDSRRFHFGTEMIEMPDARVRYYIKKSPDAQWHLNQTVSARGRRSQDARDLASSLAIPLQMSLGALAIPREIPFLELSKWRDQEAHLEVLIPVGKYVWLDEEVCGYSYVPVDQQPTGRQLYQMMANGSLVCQDCAQQESSTSTTPTTTPTNDSDQGLTFQNYRQLKISGPMKVTIEQGDSYDLRFSGNDNDLNQVTTTQDGELLIVTFATKQARSSVRLYISAPNLQELTFDQTDDVLIKDFHNESLSINASGDFEVKTTGTMKELNLAARNGVAIEFTGNTDFLNANLEEESRLETDRGQVQKAKLSASNGSRIKLGAGVQILEQEISDNSSLKIIN